VTNSPTTDDTFATSLPVGAAAAWLGTSAARRSRRSAATNAVDNITIFFHQPEAGHVARGTCACHAPEHELSERDVAGADFRRRPRARHRRPRHHGVGDDVAVGGPTVVRAVDARRARPERPGGGGGSARAVR